jgi:hydrogenase maturation protein HypF
VVVPADLQGFSSFRILPSLDEEASIYVPPDGSVCAECLAELWDPADRRYRYPFINCTQCGPRYTIIDRLPYDRPNTAMAGFPFCPSCRAEYEDPSDRRYHAQPLACPACGPKLRFHASASIVAGNEYSLSACIRALREGKIVAVKGVGGYHLVCAAHSDAAVLRLRERKHRPAKPFAVLLPDAVTEESLEDLGLVATPQEWALLRSPQRPIVLLRTMDRGISRWVAPGLREIGVLLPYSPLHHLLAAGFGGPLVATSANRSGEPVLTDPVMCEAKLGTVADAFLHHDRPILRPADDSVFRSIVGKPRPLRLGRGLTPLELRLARPVAMPTLALGADFKNTIALAVEDRVIFSPHLGDLGSPRSLDVFEGVIQDFSRLYRITPELLVCDAHPDFFSRRWAERNADTAPPVTVFHHHAHASALYGEHCSEGPILVFVWDGVGYGPDRTLWGSEALLGEPGRWRRFASLRPFRLPGGDKAQREPWRSALALCWGAGQDKFAGSEFRPRRGESRGVGKPWRDCTIDVPLLRQAWERGIQCPVTTSAGRLFEAAAVLLGKLREQSYEGQAGMMMEAIAESDSLALDLPMYREQGVWRIDWSPLLSMLMESQRSAAERSSCFHASLARAILLVAEQARTERRIGTVGLAGGVFQNRVLTEQALALLERAGFDTLLPEILPVNDAAISFGQIVEIAFRS